MNKVLLLDSTEHLIRPFESYKQADNFRSMNNRPDWTIKNK